MEEFAILLERWLSDQKKYRLEAWCSMLLSV
jgi:hypothetical protein